jgi:hypothetical protein
MIQFFKSLTVSSGLGIKALLQERSQCPLLTCNKICYGYLNNDWVMVFSNLFVLAASVFLLAHSRN